MNHFYPLFTALFFLAACGGSAPATWPAEPIPQQPAETPAETPAPPPAERVCGGMLAGQDACPENEFCDYPVEARCGAADATGICHGRPEICTMDYRPVCGCDDRTYSNPCQAASAGVSVASEGECPQRFAAAGEICGTRGALPCAEGLFCDFPAGAQCGRADAPGACAPKPETCETRVRRVCGCDGTTYPNACAAHLAGVSVEANRACPAR